METQWYLDLLSELPPTVIESLERRADVLCNRFDEEGVICVLRMEIEAITGIPTISRTMKACLSGVMSILLLARYACEYGLGSLATIGEYASWLLASFFDMSARLLKKTIIRAIIGCSRMLRLQ